MLIITSILVIVIKPSSNCLILFLAEKDDKAKFIEASRNGNNLVPLYRCIFSDHLTPVLAYRCLVKEDDREAPSFLFESVEQGSLGNNVVSTTLTSSPFLFPCFLSFTLTTPDDSFILQGVAFRDGTALLELSQQWKLWQRTIWSQSWTTRKAIGLKSLLMILCKSQGESLKDGAHSSSTSFLMSSAVTLSKLLFS